jgi:hypothetical protein
MNLYSYCLRYDDGAAPNPYWGTCSLVICKPAIRRTAEKNDWVVGLGSTNSLVGDISASVVYAMRVTDIMTLEGYDVFCQRELPNKIPDWSHGVFARKVGDCIYDYSQRGKPKLRSSVHNQSNRLTDLGGHNALLSSHFYYFGDKPVRLPKKLEPIVHRTQGHKSRANSDYVDEFVSWIEGLGLAPCSLHGEPQLKSKIMQSHDCRGLCARQDNEEDQDDRIIC